LEKFFTGCGWFRQDAKSVPNEFQLNVSDLSLGEKDVLERPQGGTHAEKRDYFSKRVIKRPTSERLTSIRSNSRSQAGFFRHG